MRSEIRGEKTGRRRREEGGRERRGQEEGEGGLEEDEKDDTNMSNAPIDFKKHQNAKDLTQASE